ncbi:amidohydrolase family protein [Solitalea lacus]|uniref:amidohydrolase family protein n=1 Tax=Solitalea lacus TaxID=2911172 RepID=UPI001EDBF16B|nr:amidohydrolase family protein [Solitalea lacus]UKJ07020.1 amidohydrolase family protein [Solitalea lacus]
MKLIRLAHMLKHKFLLFISFTPILLFVAACSRYDMGIVAGTLIDGNGDTPQTNKLILINDGRIEAIKDTSEKNNYHFTTLIDAHDKFVIPGLYDMHGHLTMSYRTIKVTDGVPQASVEYNQQASEWGVRSLLYYGITSVRETGDFLEEGLLLKKIIDSDRLIGPRIFTCGPLIESSTPEFKTMSVLVNTPEEARAEVRRQVNAKVDFIKIYATVPPQILKAIIEEAHKYKKKVIGHMGASTWREAIDAGIDALVHPAPFCDKSMADLDN